MFGSVIPSKILPPLDTLRFGAFINRRRDDSDRERGRDAKLESGMGSRSVFRKFFSNRLALEPRVLPLDRLKLVMEGRAGSRLVGIVEGRLSTDACASATFSIVLIFVDGCEISPSPSSYQRSFSTAT